MVIFYMHWTNELGERIFIRKSPDPVLLVENPQAQEWQTLAAKLNWAASPGYNLQKP